MDMMTPDIEEIVERAAKETGNTSQLLTMLENSETPTGSEEPEPDTDYMQMIEAARDHLEDPTKDTIEAAAKIARQAITMKESRPEAYLLLADCHVWIGHLQPAYIAYQAAFNKGTPGTWAWAKAAHMAYDTTHDPMVEDRPSSLSLPEWMTDPSLLLGVAESCIASLGNDTPGAWKMKADALEKLGHEMAAASAKQRVRNEVARQIRQMSGQEKPMASGDDPEAPSKHYGKLAAIMDFQLGLLPYIAGDGEGNPSYPIRNIGDDQTPALYMVGTNGKWPAGCEAEMKKSLMQAASGDCFTSVPFKRWVLENEVDVKQITDTQHQCVLHGGFIENAEMFDNTAFGISPAEAHAMDPQQRLLLEMGYKSLHEGGAMRQGIMGGDTGVFLGIERPDWALVQPPSARASVYSVTGDNVSVAAGRISFVLGLQGPCQSFDTACASALTAAHAACNAVRNLECGNPESPDVYTASGLMVTASLKLSPLGTMGAAQAGMLSTDGRCKTLDARANGYARGECIGAMTLRFCKDPRGDAIWGYSPVFSGSEVRQDGRSASLTAPNGSAQRKLLAGAVRRSNVVTGEVQWVEAHGTGTPLGDPTEQGALGHLFGGADPDRRAPLSIGAAKGNVGHTESPSGSVGLVKAAYCMLRDHVIPGNCHLKQLNPLVDERLRTNLGAVFHLPTQTNQVDELAPTISGCGGVSSFGFSGTISHVIVRRCTYDEPNRAEEESLKRHESMMLAQLGMVDPDSVPHLVLMKEAREKDDDK